MDLANIWWLHARGHGIITGFSCNHDWYGSSETEREAFTSRTAGVLRARGFWVKLASGDNYYKIELPVAISVNLCKAKNPYVMDVSSCQCC